jgi:branched-chain amino acid transport system ATP-binding protein
MTVVMPALELRGVTAGYGRIEVLHGVDLLVPAGAVFALLGANGAGKSTTLEVIGGTVATTAGCVHLDGEHINGLAPEKLVRRGVCRIPEGRGIFANLTVRENLRIWTYGTDQSLRDVESLAYERFPRLEERRRQLAGTLSGGEQQMLAMARALLGNPRLLLLDEISMGLAPKVVHELFEVVAALAATGITVLVVEQFAKTALAVADYAAVMAQGTILAVGQPADVEDLVHEAYLGGAA